MKKEVITAVVLLLFIGFICFYMLLNWQHVKEVTTLHGAINFGEK